MAHAEQREFFEWLRERQPAYFMGVNVLEIGSLDINGSVRDFFTGCDYIGVDVASGPGVDVVAFAENLKYPDCAFDTVVSAECFEHNPEWRATFANMARMCSGLVVFTCATTGRAEHGTRRSSPDMSPLTLDWDYYQNLTAEDFKFGTNLRSMFSSYTFTTNQASHDLYFWGIVHNPQQPGAVAA
jgi:SAM-dependent methyltransferase